MDSNSLLPERATFETEIQVPASLVASAKQYAKNSRADSTTRVYQADWLRFTVWCAEAHLSPLPVAAETLVLYLTHRADLGRRPSVLEREMASLSVAHRLAGYLLPRHDPLVREVIAGIRRSKKVAPKQALPLLPPDLRVICAQLPDTLAGARDRAILLMGFAGAFRGSEIGNLLISNVTFSDDGATVLLGSSKTDQEGRGRPVGLPWGTDPAFCPVRAVKSWLAASHLKRGFLFRCIDRWGVLRLQKLGGEAISLIVKTRAEEAGLDAEKISSHSLRAGLATAAARAGKSMTAIQRQTGHKSIAMVARYVRDGTLFTDNAASGIGL